MFDGFWIVVALRKVNFALETFFEPFWIRGSCEEVTLRCYDDSMELVFRVFVEFDNDV